MERPSLSCVRLSLTQKTVLAVLLALCTGLLLAVHRPSPQLISLINYPGALFIRALKLLVTPMICCTMVSIASEIKGPGASVLGRWALGYYTLTTLVAAFSGLIWISLLAQVTHADAHGSQAGEGVRELPQTDAVEQILRIGATLVPENLFEALASGNMLGLIVFFGVLGVALSAGEDSQQTIAVFRQLQAALMRLVNAVIALTPFAVFSLILAQASQVSSLVPSLGTLGGLLLTVVVAFAWHSLVFYQLLFWLCTGSSPLTFLRHLFQALTTAFATSSSAATLPVTIHCVEHAGIRPQAARFVLPLGATLNMDATALYYPVAVIFIASQAGIHLPVGAQISTALTCALLSMGVAPIPNAGLMYLVVALETAGVPLTQEVQSTLSLVLAMVWLIDRLGTVVNVLGDAFAAACVDALVGGRLQLEEQPEMSSCRLSGSEGPTSLEPAQLELHLAECAEYDYRLMPSET